jgi:hypothetical protein
MSKRLTLTEELDRILVSHEHAVRFDVELSHTNGVARKEKMRIRSNTAWSRFHEKLALFENKLKELQGE